MKKQLYKINNESYLIDNGEQLVKIISMFVEIGNAPLCVEPVKDFSITKFLEDIRAAAWNAQASLAGIIAITSEIENYLVGNTLDDSFTIDHLSWLHTDVQDKTSVMEDTIAAIREIQNKEKQAVKRAKQVERTLPESVVYNLRTAIDPEPGKRSDAA